MANPLANQAAQYANAAVPTVGSINQQYQTGTNDVHGFTTALIKLLQQGQGQDPYSGAVNSQQAANSEAVQRLSNLGSPYAAGSAAAVGGMGDSALGNLNQQRAAGISYQRQLPSIAAARGELANSTLLTNKQTALTQRSQQYQSAYMQALQQLRDYGLQKQQLNLSRQTQAQNNAYRYAALTQSQNQFSASQKQQYSEFLTSQANALKQAQTGGSGAYTASDIRQFYKTGSSFAGNAILSGEPIQQTINQLVQSQGIPPNLARQIALSEYQAITPPNKQDPHFYDTKGNFNQRAFNAATGAYKRAIGSFKMYLKQAATAQGIADAHRREANAKGGIPKGGTGRGNAHG